MPNAQVWGNWGDDGLKCNYESFEKRVNLQAQQLRWFKRQNDDLLGKIILVAWGMTMNLQDFKIVIKMIEIIERSIQIRKY